MNKNLSVATFHRFATAASASMSSNTVEYFGGFYRGGAYDAKLLGFDVSTYGGNPSNGPVLITMSYATSITGGNDGAYSPLWDGGLSDDVSAGPGVAGYKFTAWTSFNLDHTIMEWLISPRGGYLDYNFPVGAEIFLPASDSSIVFSSFCESSDYNLSATFRFGV